MTLSDQIKNVGLIVAGAIASVVLLVLYKYNAQFFGMLLSVYMITYISIVLLYVYNKVENRDGYFGAITNVSFYTIVVQVVILFLTIIGYVKSRSRK